MAEETTTTTTEEPKKKTTAKSGKKKRDAKMHPPRKNYLVAETKVRGNTVTCIYNPRTALSKAKSEDYECTSPEHAELFAKHAPKIHARWKLSGLRYSLNKYLGDSGFEALKNARQRAVLRKLYRKAEAERKAIIRKALQEEAQRKREMSRR